MIARRATVTYLFQPLFLAGRIDFSPKNAVNRTISTVLPIIFCSSPFSRRSYPVFRQQLFFRQHQIAQSKQTEQLCRVLGKSAVTDFAMTEDVLQQMKRMLHLRAHRCLGMFQRFECSTVGAFFRQFFDLAAPGRHPPFNVEILGFFTFLNARVAGIGEDEVRGGPGCLNSFF